MDGAPLMMRCDNDHHGRFDAEGGRRPPHHRNPAWRIRKLPEVRRLRIAEWFTDERDGVTACG
jgi:hypothetical protein